MVSSCRIPGRGGSGLCSSASRASSRLNVAKELKKRAETAFASMGLTMLVADDAGRAERVYTRRRAARQDAI
jgi:hypothetical protein